MISNLIPNDLGLRQKLITASTFEDPSEREVAIAAATAEIRQRYPHLYWSVTEEEAMDKAWATARAVRLQNAMRNKEMADLLAKSTGGVAHVCA